MVLLPGTQPVHYQVIIIKSGLIRLTELPSISPQLHTGSRTEPIRGLPNE